MKYSPIYLLLIGIIFSCSEPITEEASTTPPTETYFELPENGRGLWISQNYIAHLNEFKSPRESQSKELDRLVSIRNLDTVMYLSFHEGAAWNIVLMNTERNGAVFSPDSNSKYDDLIFTENLLVLGGDTFLKTKNTNSEADILPLINQALIVGEYSENEQIVSFKADGKINGLLGFDAYKFLLDYYDMGRNLDIISLKNDSTENWSLYQFNFDSDTLFIRENECENMDSETGDCWELKEGKVIYKLINRQQITAAKRQIGRPGVNLKG